MSLIINATSIGRQLNGIGVYTLNLIREFAKSGRDMKYIIYCNRAAQCHLTTLSLPPHMRVRWVSKYLAPDYGLTGHLLRLIFTQFLSAGFPRALIFNPSQLEIMPGRYRQVVTIHDLIPLLFPAAHRRQYYFFRYLLGSALRQVAAVITPSYHTRDLLVRQYRVPETRVQVIHNGVPQEHISGKGRRAEDRENYILYVGRMTPAKNVAGLIRAFRLIMDDIEHTLLLVGDDGNSLAGDTVGIPPERLEFRGYLDQSEIRRLLGRAAVFVFPSFYEGFGFPPLEAMACGCPVVVSKVSSLPEICGEAAYYVNPSSDESIAKGIQTVLTKASLRQALVQKGFEQIRKYTWESSARRHLEVFRDLDLETRR